MKRDSLYVYMYTPNILPLDGGSFRVLSVNCCVVVPYIYMDVIHNMENIKWILHISSRSGICQVCVFMST